MKNYEICWQFWISFSAKNLIEWFLSFVNTLKNVYIGFLSFVNTLKIYIFFVKLRGPNFWNLFKIEMWIKWHLVYL